jgi:hypothetical protein
MMPTAMKTPGQPDIMTHQQLEDLPQWERSQTASSPITNRTVTVIPAAIHPVRKGHQGNGSIRAAFRTS